MGSYLVAFPFLGCGVPEPPGGGGTVVVVNDEAPFDGSRITLRAAPAGATEGLVLASHEVVPVISEGYGYDFGDADFYLSAAIAVSLIATGDEQAFCDRGAGFDALADIPPTTDGCIWSYASLGWTAVGPLSFEPGRGYVVRSLDGEHVERLRLLDGAVEEDGSVWVTFELAP